MVVVLGILLLQRDGESKPATATAADKASGRAWPLWGGTVQRNLVNLFEMNAKYANVITLDEALTYVAAVDAWRGAPAGATSRP